MHSFLTQHKFQEKNALFLSFFKKRWWGFRSFVSASLIRSTETLNDHNKGKGSQIPNKKRNDTSCRRHERLTPKCWRLCLHVPKEHKKSVTQNFGVTLNGTAVAATYRYTKDHNCVSNYRINNMTLRCTLRSILRGILCWGPVPTIFSHCTCQTPRYVPHYRLISLFKYERTNWEESTQERRLASTFATDVLGD